MTDLDTLEALEKAATPGRWSADVEIGNEPDDVTVIASDVDGEGTWATAVAAECDPEDAALIAALRNAAPALLRRLRRLEAVAEAARADQHAHATIGVDLETRVHTSQALDDALRELEEVEHG